MITRELSPPPGFLSKLPLLSSLSWAAAIAAVPVRVTEPETKVVLMLPGVTVVVGADALGVEEEAECQ